MTTRTRLVIFDFDGVLADTEGLHCEAFIAVLREEGVAFTPEEYYRGFLGLPDDACVAAAFAAGGRQVDEARVAALVQRKREEFAARAAAAKLFPGVEALVRELRARHTLAIASGAFREEIEDVLARARLRDCFAAIVAAEDVARGKPFPDPFLRALSEVNRGRAEPLDPPHCLVVEDSPRGIDAARAAGMRCVAVATSHAREALAHADAVLDHVRDLADAGDLLA